MRGSDFVDVGCWAKALNAFEFTFRAFSFMCAWCVRVCVLLWSYVCVACGASWALVCLRCVCALLACCLRVANGMMR